MTYFDEARAIDGMLRARGMTQASLAKMMGVSQPYIANKLRLLNFSEKTEAAIVAAGLTERHARSILRLPTDEERIAAVEKVRVGKMSVAETEIAVDSMLLSDLVIAPSGTNFAERVGHFEKIIDRSIINLRSFGIRARATTERDRDKLYITICIE